MYDYVVAELRCPRCGATSSISENTNMQTYIRADADGSALGVGYSFDPRDLTTEHLFSAGYALISPPLQPGSMRLLDLWICPAGQTEQWAMIEIVDGRIDRIEAVAMNRATFETANFISEGNADFLAEAISGIAQSEIAERKLSSVEILQGAAMARSRRSGPEDVVRSAVEQQPAAVAAELDTVVQRNARDRAAQ
jgi:hypothetical protein